MAADSVGPSIDGGGAKPIWEMSVDRAFADGSILADWMRSVWIVAK
jgi:hypothetical protein